MAGAAKPRVKWSGSRMRMDAISWPDSKKTWPKWARDEIQLLFVKGCRRRYFGGIYDMQLCQRDRFQRDYPFLGSTSVDYDSFLFSCKCTKKLTDTFPAITANKLACVNPFLGHLLPCTEILWGFLSMTYIWREEAAWTNKEDTWTVEGSDSRLQLLICRMHANVSCFYHSRILKEAF